MIICAAQTKSLKGDIASNIVHHLHLIHEALSFNPQLILFPELSITGYEPSLARSLAVGLDDVRFNPFQTLSDAHKVAICIGAPIHTTFGTQIGMIIFSPHEIRSIYSKQLLHEDELPYFIKGDRQQIIHLEENKVAPAICYESLLTAHAEAAVTLGARVYATSVAKTEKGITKAYAHYPVIARSLNIPVIMCNSIGPNDNFISAGQSAAWNGQGELINKLEAYEEGILVADI